MLTLDQYAFSRVEFELRHLWRIRGTRLLFVVSASHTSSRLAPGGDCSYLLVGPDCLRRNREATPYGEVTRDRLGRLWSLLLGLKVATL